MPMPERPAYRTCSCHRDTAQGWLARSDIRHVRRTAAFMTITTQLERDGRVELRGFGVFEVHSLRPRRVRNPRTGEESQVGWQHRPWFVGTPLKKRLNNDR